MQEVIYPITDRTSNKQVTATQSKQLLLLAVMHAHTHKHNLVLQYV